MNRVISYVDGFNLYFGLRQARFKRYYWLDLAALSRALLRNQQTLAGCHYFTSRIRATGANAADVARQSDYLDALSTNPDITQHFGHFLPKAQTCQKCGSTWTAYEEKMTDVNIAAQLLCDAQDTRFDTALIISGDSDLTRPVELVRARHPTQRVVIALPPKRRSNQLQQAANGYFIINETALRHSQLPPTVTMPNGHVITRPASWR